MTSEHCDQTPEVRPDRVFNAGDLVRIRDYEDMALEFGVGSAGNVRCRCGFTREMRLLCGVQFVITEIEDDVYVSGCDTHWTISTDMIELVLPDSEVADEDVDGFVGILNAVR